MLIAFTLLLLNGSNVYAANNDISSNEIITNNVILLADEKQDDFSTNCADFAKTIRIGGYLLLIVKIVLPLIIMVKASVSMFSTVTAGNSNEIKKKLTKLMYSLIAAALIFFTPIVVNTLMKVATDAKGIDYKTSDSEICRICIFEPNNEICAVNANKENK